MFREFLTNISIFTSILFIFNHILKSNSHDVSPRKLQFKIGIGQGFLGVILMFFTIHVTPTIIVDLRHLAIVTAAFLGGLPAALLTGSIILSARILLFGGLTKAAIVASLNALTSSILCGIIAEKTRNFRLKWLLINLICIIIFAIYTSTLFTDKNTFFHIFIYYSIASIIGAILVGILLRYLTQANKLEIELKESEERNRRLIELLPESLVVHIKGNIVYANKAAETLLSGLDGKSILNRKVLDFVHTDSIETVKERIHAMQTSHHISVDQIEEKLITADQKVFDAEVSASSISYKGQPAILTIFRDISDRKITELQIKKVNEKLVLLASIDGLTGIANRRNFDETLLNEWQTCQTAHVPLSLIIFDIDYFKLYNDTYGHVEGDECLKKIATTASQIMENYDGLLARYGGEEFVIILPNTDATKALSIAENIRTYIESLQIPHQNSLTSSVVTSSVGVATCIPSTENSIEILLEQADKALYYAKNSGRNRVELYEVSLELK